eukprot:EG_transcript_14120
MLTSQRSGPTGLALLSPPAPRWAGAAAPAAQGASLALSVPGSAPRALDSLPSCPRTSKATLSTTRSLFQKSPTLHDEPKRWYDVKEAKDLDAGGWRPTAKMPRKFFVGANWKCNGDRDSIQALVAAWNKGTTVAGRGVEVVVTPPASYADYTRYLLRPDFAIGHQNCWTGPGGAFTGELSADMIKDSFSGSQWVILGHSERRLLPALRESDDTVAVKTAYAASKGLGVILCVGETAEERAAGQTKAVTERQLAAVAAQLTDWDNVVVAYEPVWAIGTGKVATPEQAQEVHAQIRQWLESNVSPKVAQATRIIYGGSVTAQNSTILARQPDIDGFLVGGASLKPEFLQIVEAWQQKLQL